MRAPLGGDEVAEPPDGPRQADRLPRPDRGRPARGPGQTLWTGPLFTYDRIAGSSGLARAPDRMTTSRSAWTRVATAHSSSTGSKMSMSLSVTMACLMSAIASSAAMAFLPSPYFALIAATTCQWQQPPGVML